MVQRHCWASRQRQLWMASPVERHRTGFLEGERIWDEDDFDADQITHEIGHALGLSIPIKKILSIVNGQRTIASCRTTSVPMAGTFPSQTQTMKPFKESEEGKMTTCQPMPPAQTGERAILSEGQEDSAYILTEAELLQGYSDPNGTTSLFQTYLSINIQVLSRYTINPGHSNPQKMSMEL